MFFFGFSSGGYLGRGGEKNRKEEKKLERKHERAIRKKDLKWIEQKE